MTQDILLTLSLLLGAGLAARFVASLLRVPEILLLVLAGALFGPSVLDVIDVPLDSIGAQLIFTLGVSLILFYGGLNLSLRVLRRVWLGLGMLVLPGVVLTAAIVGIAAHAVFDLSWTAAFLMGAVLSPTDPAILIPLFVRSRLRPKVAQTVVAESAFNDPTGAVLALALAGVLLSGDASLATPAGDFLGNLAISTVVGVLAGVLLAATISSRRAGIWRESAPAAVLAVVTIGYFSLDSAGGSGYLGAFLAGLIVGNMEHLGWPCIPSTSVTCGSSPSTSPISSRCSSSWCLARTSPSTPWGSTCCRRSPCWPRFCCSPGRLPCSPARSPTGARAGPGPRWSSSAGRARPASCRRRWWACSPASGCRTPMLMPASWLSRS